MTGTARKPSSVFNTISRLKRMEDELEGKARIIYSATQGVSAGAHPQGAANPPENDSKAMHFLGEPFDAPFGYVGSVFAINNDDVTINLDSTGDGVPERGIVYVTPQSGVTDDLKHIIGNVPSGAVIWVFGLAGNTITVWHNFGALDEGRIMLPNDQNFDLVGDDYFVMVQDQTKSNLTWRVLTNSGSNTEIADSDTKVVVDDSTPDIQFQIDGVTEFSMVRDGSGDEYFLVGSNAYIDMNGENIVNLGAMFGDNGTLEKIESLVGGWSYNVDSGDIHDFKVNQSSVSNINGDGMDFIDEKSIQSASGFMGFSCANTKPTMTATSNVGALVIPYKESTDSSPSASTLNDWFGGDGLTGGVIGLQYDSSAASGSNHVLWIKSNSGWQRIASV